MIVYTSTDEAASLSGRIHVQVRRLTKAMSMSKSPDGKA